MSVGSSVARWGRHGNGRVAATLPSLSHVSVPYFPAMASTSVFLSYVPVSFVLFLSSFVMKRVNRCVLAWLNGKRDGNSERNEVFASRGRGQAHPDKACSPVWRWRDPGVGAHQGKSIWAREIRTATGTVLLLTYAHSLFSKLTHLQQQAVLRWRWNTCTHFCTRVYVHERTWGESNRYLARGDTASQHTAWDSC